MSQMGMQMPGGARMRRGPSLDVFTALAFLAVVFLAVACVMVGNAAKKVGKGGEIFTLQEPGKVQIAGPRP